MNIGEKKNLILQNYLQAKDTELELEDGEILIDFKPAPVSPDARALLNEMANPYRRYVSLQKTLSDGEIQVERRELIGETSEPSYPHSCIRNYQDPWSKKKIRSPVEFSSTPDDLSLFRITSPPDDHYDEVRFSLSLYIYIYIYIFLFQPSERVQLLFYLFYLLFKLLLSIFV